MRASIAVTISLAVLFVAAAASAGGSAGSTSRGSTGGSPPVIGGGSNVREDPTDPGVFKRVIVALDEPPAGRTIVDGGASA